MRKNRARGYLVLGLAAVSLVIAAPADAKSGRVVASASGGSHFDLENVFGLALLELKTFTFNARIYADGSVRGRYNYRSFEDGAPFNARGPLMCVVIEGNRAWLGGLIAKTSEPSLAGADMWFQVADNGEPGADETPDMTTLIGAGGPGTAQDYCDRAPEPRFPWPVEHGNIQVRPAL